MTPTTTAPPTWSVWFRPHARAPWHRVAEGLTSEAAAWRVALAYPLSGDKAAVRGNKDPNMEQRPR